MGGRDDAGIIQITILVIRQTIICHIIVLQSIYLRVEMYVSQNREVRLCIVIIMFIGNFFLSLVCG